MTPRLVITSAADRDVGELAIYLGEVAKRWDAANRLLDRFEEQAAAYSRQPTMGDPREDLGDDLRSFLFSRKYVEIYEPLSDGIRILRVFDATRDYVPLFLHRG